MTNIEVLEELKTGIYFDDIEHLRFALLEAGRLNWDRVSDYTKREYKQLRSTAIGIIYLAKSKKQVAL